MYSPPNLFQNFSFFKINKISLPFTTLHSNFITFTIRKNIEMELIGTVKKLFDVQTFNSGFQKRELILLTQEQYPQPISIEFYQIKLICSILFQKESR